MNRTPALNLPPAVLWLGIILAAVHGLRQVISEQADSWALLAFAFIPARYGGIAELLPGGLAARFWSPVSYALLHADGTHLLVNLVWMASFGGALARRIGSVRFLFLSVVAAAAGAALHYAVYPGDEALVIGASGAVSGMTAATARFAFSPGGPLAGGGRSPGAYTLPAEPLGTVIRSSRALGFILVWFGLNLLFGLAGGLVPGASGPIAWQAHIGGFLAGLLTFPLFDPVPRHRPGDEVAP